jgi:aspartate racemase
MTKEKIIGVVAGVGPFAGFDLLRKIAEQTDALRDQEHLSVASISQPRPIGDRTGFLLGKIRLNPGYAIAEQLHTLSQMGACVAGIPCNTAHAPAIFDIIRRMAPDDLRLLHMIDEVIRHIQDHHAGIRKVGVLSTTGTYKSEMYPELLEGAGFRPIVPSKGVQSELINQAIYDPVYGLKAVGKATERSRDALGEGLAHLRAKGAEAVILGCTEIPLAITEKSVGGAIILDPTLILARALIREVEPDKLKSLELPEPAAAGFSPD